MGESQFADIANLTRLIYEAKDRLVAAQSFNDRIKIKFETVVFGYSTVGQFVDTKLKEEFFSIGSHSIRTEDIKRTRILKTVQLTPIGKRVKKY